MSMQDPIADLLTRLRNAQMVSLPQVEIPASKLKLAVCQVLLEEGYIVGCEEVSRAGRPLLLVELKYFEGKPAIVEIARVSRPGLRHYAGKDKMPAVRGGLGVAIVSTSRGVMTARAARVAGVGGEVLCTVF